MIKRFENFGQFAGEMAEAFLPLANERMKLFCNIANTLNQGCGCTRNQRAERALAEWYAIGEYLDEASLAVIRAKFPNHTIEFAQDGPVFFVIEAI